MKNSAHGNRLAKRFGMYVILCSTVITIFTTGFQLFTEFRRDTDEINTRLEQIERTLLNGIASRLWELDTEELKATLEGILHLPSIRYVSVYDYNKRLISIGEDVQSNMLSRQFPLFKKGKAGKVQIGRLEIKVSLDDVYDRVIDRAVIILSTNAMKTFLVAGFILFLFYWLIGRHLSKIGDFAGNLSIESLGDKFRYNRKENPEEGKDELDYLSDSLATMQSNLRSAIHEKDARETDLQTTLNSIGDAVIKTDVNGKIQKMNPAAERITGWIQSSVINKKLTNILFMTGNKDLGSMLSDVVRGVVPEYLGGQAKIKSKSGKEYSVYISLSPVSVEGEVSGIVLVLSDFTEEKRLHEEVEKSRKELTSIMDNTPAVIYTRDNEGYFTYVNHAFELLYNVNRSLLIGKTLYDIFSSEVAMQLYRNDKAVLVSGCPLEFEEEIPDAESVHIYLSHKFPLYDGQGKITGVCGISTDITDKKVHEEQLRRGQKMDALGKLTGGIAHDFNNMLGIIVGYSDLLGTALKGDGKLASYVEQIRLAGERGGKLTRKLLSISKTNQSDPASVDITSVLREDSHMLQKTLTSRIQLTMDLEDKLWPVWLDRGDLEDAVLNMAINAMHAIDGNGEIIIKTENFTVDEACGERLSLVEGDYVVLTVMDNGCGMNEETLSRVFDPFYSTKGDMGTGLGLSQVYGFVKRSLGVIHATSRPGCGTSFSMYFPRSYSSVDISCVNAGQGGVDVDGFATILVVDDEHSIVKLVFDVLEGSGFKVLGAYSAKQALELLDKNDVDIMLSDVIMPEMNGLQLASIVSKEYPNVRIQMMSGFTDDIDENEANLQGKSLLHKPFNLDMLLTRIGELQADLKRL